MNLSREIIYHFYIVDHKDRKFQKFEVISNVRAAYEIKLLKKAKIKFLKKKYIPDRSGILEFKKSILEL